LGSDTQTNLTLKKRWWDSQPDGSISAATELLVSGNEAHKASLYELRQLINLCKQDWLVFDNICDFFNCQLNRLSDIEKSVMYWLAINREPVSLQELRDDLFLPQEFCRFIQTRAVLVLN
jgi:hypothetical protein